MPATPKEIEDARRNLVAWIRWLMAKYPEKAANDAALARAVGVSGPAIHYWFKTGSTRLPSFTSLLALKKIYGIPLDMLLGSPPPSE